MAERGADRERGRHVRTVLPPRARASGISLALDTANTRCHLLTESLPKILHPEARAMAIDVSTWLAFSLVALATGPAASAPADTARFVFRDVAVGGERHRYAAWLPRGFDASRTWPAIVCLHGSGECGSDGVKPTAIGLGPQLKAHPERWPFVVVFP